MNCKTDRIGALTERAMREGWESLKPYEQRLLIEEDKRRAKWLENLGRKEKKENGNPTP